MANSARRAASPRTRRVAPPLAVTRTQILAYRQHVGALDRRLPSGRRSLRTVAWAGLQDSVPRAALLAIHARVEGTGPTTWEDPSLVQLWGPRHSVFVVAARDHAVFALGTMPDDEKGRAVAEDLAARLTELLGDRRMPYGDAGEALGEPNANRLRYAAATGTVRIRWDGARQPTIWSVPRPDLDPRDARLELARRYLHVVGPTTPRAFAAWVGIAPRAGAAAFEGLGRSVVPVRTPVGDAWILARDEAAIRADLADVAPARFLPSGDPYLLAGDRELLVADAVRRRQLWPPATVWPGGVLVEGELVGTWRRAQREITISPWRRLSRSSRDAVDAEAASLPIPGLRTDIAVRWDDR